MLEAFEYIVTHPQEFAFEGFENRFHLFITGGYDARVPENKQVLEELQATSTLSGISQNCTFVPSCSDEERVFLLSNALAVIYTPSFEHFGIVPLEAMYCGTPVIAVNNGQCDCCCAALSCLLGCGRVAGRCVQHPLIVGWMNGHRWPVGKHC